MWKKTKELMNRMSLYSVLIGVSMLVAIPAMAVEKRIKMSWVYPDHLSSVIHGFRIYDARNTDSPVVLATIKQGSLRTYETVLDIPYGVTCFFMAPFIGDKEGDKSDVGCVDLEPPMEGIKNFTVEFK